METGLLIGLIVAGVVLAALVGILVFYMAGGRFKFAKGKSKKKAISYQVKDEISGSESEHPFPDKIAPLPVVE